MKKLLLAIMILASAAACHPYDDYTVGEAEFDTQINNIDILWSNGKVEIGYWEGNTMRIFEDSLEPLPYDQTMCWERIGRTLRIRTGRSTKSIYEKVLHVQLPKNSQYRDLEVNTSSANVFCDIDCDEVDIETTSGNIEFYTFMTRTEVELESVSGNVLLGLPSDKGFYVDYTTISGAMKSDFFLTGQRGHYEYLNGGPTFEVTTVSGNLELIIND